jgi:hypothetical protein
MTTMTSGTAKAGMSATPRDWPQDVREKATEVLNLLNGDVLPNRGYWVDGDARCFKIILPHPKRGLLCLAWFSLEKARAASAEQLCHEAIRAQSTLLGHPNMP